MPERDLLVRFLTERPALPLREAAALLRQLGDASDLIPRELHLMRVQWELPAYLVRAMEAQARLQRGGVDVEEHVAEVLHLALDDETVAFFRDDAGFMTAYDYPESSDGEA